MPARNDYSYITYVWFMNKLELAICHLKGDHKWLKKPRSVNVNAEEAIAKGQNSSNKMSPDMCSRMGSIVGDFHETETALVAKDFLTGAVTTSRERACSQMEENGRPIVWTNRECHFGTQDKIEHSPSERFQLLEKQRLGGAFHSSSTMNLVGTSLQSF